MVGLKLRMSAGLSSAFALGAWMLLSALPAAAHPHVWVQAQVTVLFEKGSIVGLRHKWTFDDMYTAMAIQGLDTNKDGVYDRQELADLAQVNIDGLKEFEYFTYVALGAQRLKTKAPVDFYLEHTKDGLLSLYFTLPLEQPVLTDAKGFGFQLTDPGYFIAFDYVKDDPIKLGTGAPAGCKPVLAASSKDAADAQKLAESFFAQMGQGMGGAVPTGSVACGN